MKGMFDRLGYGRSNRVCRIKVLNLRYTSYSQCQFKSCTIDRVRRHFRHPYVRRVNWRHLQFQTDKQPFREKLLVMGPIVIVIHQALHLERGCLLGNWG